MDGTTAVLERPTPSVLQTPGAKTSSALPESSQGGKLYNARHGKSKEYASFAESFRKTLNTKLQQDANPEIGLHYNETIEEAEALYTKTSTRLSPQIQEIIREMKQLGIHNDIVADESFKLLRSGMKADQWGERQRKDYPQELQTYTPDEENPLNKIQIENGAVHISTLNEHLDTTRLKNLLQTHYNTLKEFKTEKMGNTTTVLDKDLSDWVEHQAVTRDILLGKKDLQQEPLTLEGATMMKRLEKGDDVKQMSNPVEIWQTPDGRKLIVKRAPEGAEHTLRAEVLENKIMELMGIPVPPTELQDLDGTPVLVVGFLDEYKEEDNPFALSQKYHSNRVLQNGLIVDLWLNQYNRRPHNVMMKDGKIAFIDHGAALFSRATGGFKGFSSEITTENMWDLLQTIPDNDPNGDVPVNEAYQQILTVTGGPHGELHVNDPFFLRTEVARLARVTDEQIVEVVKKSGFTDGEESLKQIKMWQESKDKKSPGGYIEKILFKDELEKKLTKQELTEEEFQSTLNVNSEKLDKEVNTWLALEKPQKTEEFIESLSEKWGKKLTEKEKRDLRWSLDALLTLKKAENAGGMKNYLTQTLITRRDNLVQFLNSKIADRLHASASITDIRQELTQHKSPRTSRSRFSFSLFGDGSRSPNTTTDLQVA